MTNTTLSINFYANNITEELRNDFNLAITHEKYDMTIQLLNDTIAKLEKKIANENDNYTEEEVQAFLRRVVTRERSSLSVILPFEEE